MSLYVGNLSPGVRLDELERVFQKFGRCSLRMKGGYGFVVYDFPANAERALRALQDNYICGEQLTLTWSNRQPGAFRGAGRGGGFRERIVDRYREGGGGGGSGSGSGRGGYQNSVRGNVVGEGLGRGEDVDEDGEPNGIIDDDRWGAQFEGADVARYEPSRDYGKNAGRGHMEYAMNRSSRANAKQGCYQCGAVGHKMRDCPRGNFSGKRFHRSDHRLDEENKRKDRGKEEEIDRPGSRPKKRLRSSQDCGPVSREMSGVKSPRSVQHRRSRRDGSTPTRNEADNSRKSDYEGKTLRRKETECVKESSSKKGKSSILPRLDSDSSLSRSISKSHSSNHRRGRYSRSRSRSVSSRAHSASYSSRSRTPRRNPRANGSKYRSRSVSPRLSPQSVSTGQPLASSPHKADKTAGIYLDDNKNAEMNESLTEQGRMVEVGVLSEDAKPENFPVATNNEHATLPPELGKMEQDGTPEETTENIEIVLGSADEVEIVNSDPGDDNFVDAGNSFEQRWAGTKYCDGLMNGECATLLSKMCEIEQGGTPEENTENCETVLGSADGVARDSRGPGDDTFVDAGNSVEQRLTATKDFQNCDGSITERPSHSLINNKDRDTSYIRSSTKISSKELSMVLKHYGHSILDESTVSLYPEDYFGSARLWPWEVIYYRRLKKGPISLQNYARRVEQNKEFGITDKYIRSSSGWGELGQGNL